ncbi:hypothetical protein Q8A67_022397 [Cirrhinus molitorella]|uniref:Uncharacterized protein n=1 Tax=Cirrhinus molitorella TaxID=172907 RepID=A0AA88P3Z3_9TELE|nr:hypothetical protein Q8A67_022397 [Cirrhinus molitorella]
MKEPGVDTDLMRVYEGHVVLDVLISSTAEQFFIMMKNKLTYILDSLRKFVSTDILQINASNTAPDICSDPSLSHAHVISDPTRMPIATRAETALTFVSENWNADLTAICSESASISFTDSSLLETTFQTYTSCFGYPVLPPSYPRMSMSTMSTESLIPTDEHDELITALVAGRWWAIMEVEDLLRSSSEKGESEHLPSGQSWGIVEESPVPTAFPEEAPAPARSPEGAPVPSASPEEVYLSTVPHEEAPAPARSSEGAPLPIVASEEAPVLTRSPDGEPVLTASPEEAPSPNRAALRRKITIPENMRLYLTRDVILTPLPLRPPKGPAPPAKEPKEGPVPSTSPEGKSVPPVSPEEAHGSAMSSEGAPVPFPASEKASALTRPPEGETISAASLMKAPSQARASLRRKKIILENMRLYLKRDVILKPLPLSPLKGPAPPARAPKDGPVPSTFPEEALVPTVSPEKAHSPATSPEGELVPAASPKEAPALARSPQKAFGPTRSPGKAAVPIRFLKRAPGLAAPLRGVPWKRLCPWRAGALDIVNGVQTSPHKKQCVRKDPKASASSQHTLSSGSA